MPCLMFTNFCHRTFKATHRMFKLAFVFVFIACFVLTAEALPGSYFRVPKPRYRDPAEEGQGPSSFEVSGLLSITSKSCVTW